MFKRVERKRKRREEEEELLDQDTRETLGLNDTDSDESDSDLEHESGQSDLSRTEGDKEGDTISEDENVGEEPQMSVAEVLRDPIYLASLSPTLYGCVLCKGKLIKNVGMATAHKNARAHKRRFEHFGLLSVDADPHGNAWEFLRTVHLASSVQTTESQDFSKRAIKRQAKQAAIREKRKHHRELRAKAVAKKALKKRSTMDEAGTVVNRSSPETQIQPGRARKNRKLSEGSNAPANKIKETRNVRTNSNLRMRAPNSSKKRVPNPGLKTKANEPS